MKGSMKNLMIGLTSMMAASFLLTACNTVQGTVQGVGEDVHAVTRAAPPSPHYRKAKDHCPGHHKKKKKKKRHSTTTTQQTTTDTNMKTTNNTVQDTPQEMTQQQEMMQ